MWGEGLRGLYCWGIDWRSDILAGCTQASLVNKPYWWINPRYGCKAGGLELKGGGGGEGGRVAKGEDSQSLISRLLARMLLYSAVSIPTPQTLL